MKFWNIVQSSLQYHWRSGFALALAAAIATAILTGALVIGDSMRMSLTDLTLDRLGRIDDLLVSDGFFRTELASEVTTRFNAETTPVDASPIILFPGGTIESVRATERAVDASRTRASQVNVLGIVTSFWNFGNGGSDGEVFVPPASFDQDAVIINQTLARQLEIAPETWNDIANADIRITVRIPKPRQLPSESALGVTRDLIESIVGLKVAAIIPDKGLGRFSLQPSQVTSPNLFMPIERLQKSLRRKTLKHLSTDDICNAVLFSGLSDAIEGADLTNLLDQIQPTPADLGLRIARVTQANVPPSAPPVYDYWSLSSDRMVLSDAMSASIAAAFPQSQSVTTYLANEIRVAGGERSVPFSMVTAIEVGDTFPLVQQDAKQTELPKRIPSLADDEIVLNQWAAEDLDAEVGDTIELTWYQPETTHGDQVEASATFRLAAIAALTQPDTPFIIRRRGGVQKATFDTPPTVANDPDLTPTVPGVTDAASIENWDLPFETADKIRAEDDDYWTLYRTTPKAFLSPATGRKLFHSRFGVTTSFRIPVSEATPDEQSIGDQVMRQLADDNVDTGMRLIPIRQQALAASSGSTPFDALFLALSMFVIVSALIILTLLFRLTLQQRTAEIGLLQATGFSRWQISKLWITEMSILSLVGSVIGIVIGIGWAWLMLYGLRTWWIGAVSTPFVTLHLTPRSLIAGLLGGTVVSIATIWWSLRGANKSSVRSWLSGQADPRESGGIASAGEKPRRGWLPVAIAVCVFVAIGLAIVAVNLYGEPQAGAFMGAGFLMLAALLMSAYRWLTSDSQSTGIKSIAAVATSTGKLALLNLRRNPLRSVLTLGLIAVASFLIVAVSSFRLTPTEKGTGGFDLVATSSQPLIADLNTVAGQSQLLGDARLAPTVRTFALRLKSGQDASCNNLYQATQPQVLGVGEDFVARFDNNQSGEFAWAATTATSDAEQQNPWRMLDRAAASRSAADPVPVVIDKNTANYSLKIFAVGSMYDVEFENGQRVRFEVVGFLSNTLLQGSLIVAERDFVRLFPEVAGYRSFLIDVGDSGKASASSAASTLESSLGDWGFDARPAAEVLREFMSVQNTYLNTFQTLGGLGLLLGTFGLSAIQIRNVIERTRELGLMRAVGFTAGRIRSMIFLETAWMMVLGLGVGVASALFATVPHFLFGDASVPWLSLAVILAIILVCGMLVSLIASGVVQRRPLLASLRE